MHNVGIIISALLMAVANAGPVTNPSTDSNAMEARNGAKVSAAAGLVGIRMATLKDAQPLPALDLNPRSDDQLGTGVSKIADVSANSFVIALGTMEDEEGSEEAEIEERSEDAEVDEEEEDEHTHTHDKRLNSVVIKIPKLARRYWKYNILPIPNF